jgi:hypothetical protein
MKNYFAFLCLIISAGLAEATTQTSLSQDKPPRLYVKSYNEQVNGSGPANYGPGDGGDALTYNENCDWHDGSGGSFSQAALYSASTGLTWYRNITVNSPSGESPNPVGTEIDTSICNLIPYYNWVNTYSNAVFDVYQEHCDINVPLSVPNGKITVSRTAQTIMKLETGGKATSRIKNLVAITASVAPNNLQYDFGDWDSAFPYWDDMFWEGGPSIPIPLSSVSIGSYGTLNANGVLYKILPDNADVDITPYVAGVDSYTFGVSAQKYHSYFDLYVQQANPGYSLIFYSQTNDVGHAFWQFRTDAPSDALQYISANLTGYLGQKWGFYPSNPNNLFTALGQLQNDTNHPANISRTFYIGFPDLLQGLIYTRGISNAPPVYCLSSFNCVGAARGAGFAADVFGLPWDESPQNFGVTLIEMYPAPGQIIGPFIDTNDVFYSSAPY